MASRRLCIKPGIQERGTECGERAEWCGGRGGYIPLNVAKHSRECPETSRGMSPNIPGNVLKHSGECPQIFRGMSPNILGNVLKYSGECWQTFRGMFLNIPGNIAKYFGECPKTFRGMSPNYYCQSLISEFFTVHYVLISSNQSDYLYSFPVRKNLLLANPVDEGNEV